MPSGRTEQVARAVAGLALAVVTLASSTASAQLEELREGIPVGEWTFYPSLEVRVRGEYRRDPVDVGGDVYARTAVQHEGYQSSAPTVVRRDPAVSDLWLASERVRLGLGVELHVLSARLVLQDARVLGIAPGLPSAVDVGGLGTIEPFEAYLDVRTDVDDPTLRVRLGRQQLRWGDGRLVGESDWSARGRSLDAARMMFDFGEVDVQVLAAMLAAPGPVPPPYGALSLQQAQPDGTTPAQNAEGTGAQLYGLDGVWHIHPLFGLELTALARVARDPLPADLERNDTYTLDGRVFGEHRGFEYAAEGAYQLGRVAGYGENRDLSAFAFAGRVDWQTALPGKFRFGAHGGYASGDDSQGTGSSQGRFDPILPTSHEHHGMMDLYAWSNVIEAGGAVSARPHDDLTARAAYTFVGLAQPGDRWSTGYLNPVGAAADNESRMLGHEVDLSLALEPWEGVSFAGGYGMFILGDGGKAILDAAGRGGHDLLHYGFVQAELVAP